MISQKRLRRASGGALVLGFAMFASAQSVPRPPPCSDYLAAFQWDASVSFVYGHVVQSSTLKVDLNADATGAALLARVPSPFGFSIPSWNALAQGSGLVHDAFTSFEAQPPDVLRMDGAGGIQGLATSNASVIYLDLDPFACTYRFLFTPYIDVTISDSVNGTSFVGLDAIGSVQSNPRPLPTVTPNQPLLPLTGSASFPANAFATQGDRYVPERLTVPLFLPGFLLASNGGSATVQWRFDPNVEELELVVDPKSGSISYDDWLPEGPLGPVSEFYLPKSPSEELENQEGNSIKLEATVRRVADGLPPQTRHVAKIEFLMTQRSSEPGIALNTPPAGRLASPQPPDLKFDVGTNLAQNPIIVVDPNDSARAKAPLLSGGNTATAVLSSYDWGSFGTLEVLATLDDGKVLLGHLVSDSKVDQIPIPKRTAPSNIGDKWKLDNQAMAKADQADDEDSPVGNGEDLGDGFSLYEEYRGFFVGGFHTRAVAGSKSTDPRKRDLFVFNQYGPAAVPGFKLLEDAINGPGLNVHYGLMTQEFPSDHVMNFNHGQGHHTVDQHGLWLRRGGLGGSAAKPNSSHIAGDRLLPRNVEEIQIGTDMPPFVIATHVAHEIGHAIGTMHHGDTDLQWVRWSLDAGQVMEQELDDTGVLQGPIYVVDVRTESGCANAGCTFSAAQLAALGLVLDGDVKRLYVGNFEGQHSGQQDCFMRYDAEHAYTHEPLQQSAPRVRWWVGGDTGGGVLDVSETGTGRNLSTRSPRSRAGDACKLKERGNCKHQVRVSDALPDKPYPSAKVCQ